jgi:uncharacterized protein
MPPAGLIDTGAIVAILEASDYWHSACLEALRHLRLPLVTTEAVLTEAFHLIGKTDYHVAGTWNFVRSGAITVSPIHDSDLPDLQALMSDYADHPMDFADATLVHVAARESIHVILTIDYADFATYRIAGRKRFTILPQRTTR